MTFFAASNSDMYFVLSSQSRILVTFSAEAHGIGTSRSTEKPGNQILILVVKHTLKCSFFHAFHLTSFPFIVSSFINAIQCSSFCDVVGFKTIHWCCTYLQEPINYKIFKHHLSVNE